ncbi:MAG TPA: hypothetical protein VNJ09_09935 [Chthonomonadales bacterium]|nr:hypothetical protein [Chthonomonadales bacterium]
MPDSFMKEYVGSEVAFVLANEAGQWRGKLLDVGDQWVKILMNNQITLIPIVNVRSIKVEEVSPPYLSGS